MNSILSLTMMFSCGERPRGNTPQPVSKPSVSADGQLIRFASAENLSFIKTDSVKTSALQSDMVFPARIAATSVASEEGAGKNIILFEDPELTANYMALIQVLININQIRNISIKQRTIELDRTRDLNANGAATGKEVLEAETALAMENTNLDNERAALIEHEAKLKLAGFDPKALLSAPPGRTWVICEIPESMLQSVEKGSECIVHFSSFPNEKYVGNVEAIGDVINNSTRMVKLRLAVRNLTSPMKAGMFASVSFGQAIADALSIPKQALVTVQGKTYVFVKKSDMEFERKEIIVTALINDRVIISGLNKDEQLVTQGTMQLKGLSFGY